MKAPTSLVDRPGRALAVAAVVSVSATAAVALVSGTAAAQEPGRCTENVDIRSEPDITSRIVALCESGTAVQVGEARNGFVQLVDFGGWAAQEYLSVDGSAPAPAQRTAGPGGSSTGVSSSGGGSSSSGTSDHSTDSADRTDSTDSTDSTGGTSGGKSSSDSDRDASSSDDSDSATAGDESDESDAAGSGDSDNDSDHSDDDSGHGADRDTAEEADAPRRPPVLVGLVG